MNLRTFLDDLPPRKGFQAGLLKFKQIYQFVKATVQRTETRTNQGVSLQHLYPSHHTTHLPPGQAAQRYAQNCLGTNVAKRMKQSTYIKSEDLEARAPSYAIINSISGVSPPTAAAFTLPFPLRKLRYVLWLTL